MERPLKILITGAGGFIGGYMVGELLKQGYQVRAVDIKPQWQWYQSFPDADNLTLDLREKGNCYQAANGFDWIYNFAADMGGMGFIELNKGLCMLSVLINTHMLMAARDCGATRFFYSSSACVYAGCKQENTDNPGLKEEDAYPADPEDGYGWEKLFSERMCRHFMEDFGLATRVVRLHNVYGPNGTFDGGREKVPAAVCRKVISAKMAGLDEIEIWGDGYQTRSFMFIDDCLHGIQAIMKSDIRNPINLGSSEMVSINQLVDIVEDIAGVSLRRNYNLDAPKGVRGRSSNNAMTKRHLGWEPYTSLRTGIEKTYIWIYEQMEKGLSKDAIVNLY
jgi:GDP-D-mannose 3', 5'-epimerase